MRIAFQKAKWARAVALGLVLFAACGARDKTPATQAEGNDSPQVVFEGPRVLFLGDSLSAGLHLPANEAFPAVLAQLLAAEGHPIELVNAGVSGDTTAGGLARLDWLLRQDPDLFVLELGANDGLRGVSLESIESNLRAIVRRVQDRGIPLLLLGLRQGCDDLGDGFYIFGCYVFWFDEPDAVCDGQVQESIRFKILV